MRKRLKAYLREPFHNGFHGVTTVKSRISVIFLLITDYHTVDAKTFVITFFHSVHVKPQHTHVNSICGVKGTVDA